MSNLDPLTALTLAGPVLLTIRDRRVISSLAVTLQASDDLTKIHNLRVGVDDANTNTVAIWRIVSAGLPDDRLTTEQQTVQLFCHRCQRAGLAAARELKQASDALDAQQRNLFAKRSTANKQPLKVHIDFAIVDGLVQELIELTSKLVSDVTQSLSHTSATDFKTLSLHEDALQFGASSILHLLEHDGANVKQDDFAEDGLARQCIEMSTQVRLDSLDQINGEPYSKALQRTKLRRKIILDVLYFRQISDRIEEVNIAYERTLRWIFRDKSYKLAWSSFPEFLKSPESKLPYWINGKAGSGKSTLLRFLTRHKQTLLHLGEWSGSKNLEIGHFFSWNLGTTLQKTQTGLLQSLVYQMFERTPTMVHQVFPELWHDIDPSRPKRLLPLSLKDLKNAFVKCLELSAAKRCYCFFVDGIDEFDEDHIHVADLLLELTAPNLKFVLSSRPVDACLDRFDHCPKLRLQDLTADDIRIYIDGRLSSHSAMVEVMHDEPKEAAELVRELKDRASGVFLWVKLVVTSLLDGLRKGDDIAELKTCLRELPPDLSKLYASMLGKMDPNYSRQAATLFRLVRTASVLLDGQCMPTQFLAVAGREFRSVVNGKPAGFETTKIVRWCRFLMRQLYSRCCGLVEVTPSVYTPDWWHADLVKLPKEDRDLLSSHIQFLHRTVTEYLYQDDVWDTMISQSSELATFNPNENLAHAALHMMKIVALADRLRDMQAYQWAQIVIRAVREFEREEERPLEDLIDEMDVVLSHHITSDHHWSSQIEIEPAPKLAITHFSCFSSSIQGLLPFTAFLGLSQYVNAKLERRSSAINQSITLERDALQQILLQVLFSKSPDWTNIEFSDQAEVVNCLLEHGANPNETSRGLSFWQCCLQHVGSLDCHSAASFQVKGYGRRGNRRLRITASPRQDLSPCICDPLHVEIWSQIFLSCLAAGAERADIDYFAPFSKSSQQPQTCRYAQLCQTLYQVKNGVNARIVCETVVSRKQELAVPVSSGIGRGSKYEMTNVSGSASAHLGDEYTYGHKITHVYNNYFGQSRSELAVLPPNLLQGPSKAASIDEDHSDDFTNILAVFRTEASEALKHRSEPAAQPSHTKNEATSLTLDECIMVQDKHWRGELSHFDDRTCCNDHCRTQTTRGWEYVPILKKTLCLDCYESWRSAAIRNKDIENQDPIFSMEDMFTESFSRTSLVTMTDDLDCYDRKGNDREERGFYKRARQRGIEKDNQARINRNDSRSNSPNEALLSNSVPLNVSTSAINHSYKSLTSGSERCLKGYR